VSPTKAQHVIDDLGHADLLVVDADTATATSNGHCCCEYGIESTVIKVVEGSIVMLRRGAITQRQLEEALAANALGDVR